MENQGIFNAGPAPCLGFILQGNRIFLSGITALSISWKPQSFRGSPFAISEGAFLLCPILQVQDSNRDDFLGSCLEPTPLLDPVTLRDVKITSSYDHPWTDMQFNFYHHVHSSLVDWSPRHKKKISLIGWEWLCNGWVHWCVQTHTHTPKEGEKGNNVDNSFC